MAHTRKIYGPALTLWTHNASVHPIVVKYTRRNVAPSLSNGIAQKVLPIDGRAYGIGLVPAQAQWPQKHRVLARARPHAMHLPRCKFGQMCALNVLRDPDGFEFTLHTPHLACAHVGLISQDLENTESASWGHFFSQWGLALCWCQQLDRGTNIGTTRVWPSLTVL